MLISRIQGFATQRLGLFEEVLSPFCLEQENIFLWGQGRDVSGTIGKDILQCFNQLGIGKAYMFGKRGCGAVKVNNGYLPYGSGINSMPPNEEREYIDRILGSNDKIVVANDSDL